VVCGVYVWVVVGVNRIVVCWLAGFAAPRAVLLCASVRGWDVVSYSIVVLWFCGIFAVLLRFPNFESRHLLQQIGHRRLQRQ